MCCSIVILFLSCCDPLLSTINTLITFYSCIFPPLVLRGVSLSFNHMSESYFEDASAPTHSLPDGLKMHQKRIPCSKVSRLDKNSRNLWNGVVPCLIFIGEEVVIINFLCYSYFFVKAPPIRFLLTL